MRNPLRLFFGNPVALKELRGRMRGPRAFVVLSGFLSLVAGVTILLYLTQISTTQASATDLSGGEIGRNLFISIVAIELFLVAFIAPAFTAGAISGERERQTYDLLKTTLLPESQFVMGKLFSAMAYIFLLLLAAIPMQSFSLILGGTALEDIAVILFILLLTAILLGTMGVYFSARLKRTLSASVTTYGVALGLMIGIGVIFLVYSVFADSFLDEYYNVGQGETPPAETAEWVSIGIENTLISLNPIATIWNSLNFLRNEQTPWTYTHEFRTGNTTTLPAPWITFGIVYSLLSILFFTLTTRQVRKVDEF